MANQKGILAPQDFATIRLIVREEVKAEVSSQLDEKIGKLPTKVQFYKKMDKWMKAASTKDLEQASHKSSHNRTSQRLDKIEKHLGIATAF